MQILAALRSRALLRYYEDFITSHSGGKGLMKTVESKEEGILLVSIAHDFFDLIFSVRAH